MKTKAAIAEEERAEEPIHTKMDGRMDKTFIKIDKGLSQQLAHRKTERLGLFETLCLKTLGRADGKLGIPRPTESGSWTSSLVLKEISSYEECCQKIWGDLQLRLHESYSRCDTLLDMLLQLRTEIRAEEEREESTLPLNARKHGEESLPDKLIAERRKREADRAQGRKQAKLNALNAQFTAVLEELSELHSLILEADNAARHVCHKIMEHTAQRLEVYWRSALRVHPRGETMPAGPGKLQLPQAESTYSENHRERNRKIEQLLSQQEKMNKGGEKPQEVA